MPDFENVRQPERLIECFNANTAYVNQVPIFRTVVAAYVRRNKYPIREKLATTVDGTLIIRTVDITGHERIVVTFYKPVRQKSYDKLAVLVRDLIQAHPNALGVINGDCNTNCFKIFRTTAKKYYAVQYM